MTIEEQRYIKIFEVVFEDAYYGIYPNPNDASAKWIGIIKGKIGTPSFCQLVVKPMEVGDTWYYNGKVFRIYWNFFGTEDRQNFNKFLKNYVNKKYDLNIRTLF